MVKTSTCILSNGSFDMLNAAITNSELNNLLDAVLSVDLCKKFKPAAAVYQLVLNQYPKNAHDFLFFSSNCWDIHGASNFGFKSVWVNRFNKVNDIHSIFTRNARDGSLVLPTCNSTNYGLKSIYKLCVDNWNTMTKKFKEMDKAKFRTNQNIPINLHNISRPKLKQLITNFFLESYK